MPDAVLFLCCKGVLMLFDNIVLIVGGSADRHYAGLGSALHGKLIYIISFLLILYEIPLFKHPLKKLPRLIIYLRGIHIKAVRKACLRSVDSKE